MIAMGGLWKTHAVLSEDGNRLTFYGVTHAVDFFEWMSEEEVEAYVDSGDPADAPPNHYKLQPENQGKLKKHNNYLHADIQSIQHAKHPPFFPFAGGTLHSDSKSRRMFCMFYCLCVR